MESISKSPQRAVRLCSGNMKQLRKQASVVHTDPLLQLWVIFKRISVLGNVACAWFQILSKIILSQSCLSAMCVFRKRINIWNVIALFGSVLKEGSFEVHVVSDVGLRVFFSCCWNVCYLSKQFVRWSVSWYIGFRYCAEECWHISPQQNVVFIEIEISNNGNCNIWWDFPPSPTSLPPFTVPPSSQARRQFGGPGADPKSECIKQRLLKHKYDLISPPDEFSCVGLWHCQRALTFWPRVRKWKQTEALQLSAGSLSHLHYFSCCGDVIFSHKFRYVGLKE